MQCPECIFQHHHQHSATMPRKKLLALVHNDDHSALFLCVLFHILYRSVAEPTHILDVCFKNTQFIHNTSRRTCFGACTDDGRRSNAHVPAMRPPCANQRAVYRFLPFFSHTQVSMRSAHLSNTDLRLSHNAIANQRSVPTRCKMLLAPKQNNTS